MKSTLSEETILSLEFHYAQETSIQAQKDRLTLVNFFLGLFGGTTTLALGLYTSESLRPIIPFILILLSIIGYIFIITLVRLRQAWISSIEIMNQIKSYYKSKYENLNQVLLWSDKSIPKPQKFKTLSYLSAIIIAILGGTLIFTAFIMLTGNIFLTIFFAITSLIINIATFHTMLAKGI